MTGVQFKLPANTFRLRVKNMLPLKAKIALVTGAARDTGRGIAVELGAAEATVYVVR